MKQFGHLIAELKLDMLKGHDNYPTMVTREYSMLSEYEKKHKSHMKSSSTKNNNNNRSGQSSQTANPGTTGVAVVQQTEESGTRN